MCRHSKALLHAQLQVTPLPCVSAADLGHTDIGVGNPGNALGFDCLPTQDVATHPGMWADTLPWLEQLLAARL